MFNFSLLHSSARPQKWREIYDAWISLADDPSQVQYVLVGDQRWGFNRHSDSNDLGLREMDVYVNLYPARRCYVEGVNLAARYARGRTLIVIADDQYPCQGWDTHINRVISVIPGILDDPKQPFSLANVSSHMEWAIRIPTGTPDEAKRNITVMPIVSRSRYQRLGYVLYPGYESMHSDNDFTEHAQLDGVFVDAQDLPEFPHRHPFWTDAKMDDQYGAQNRKEAYQLGANLLNIRRLTGFGTKLATPPTPGPQPGQKSLALCLPGEKFDAQWVSYLLETFVSLLPRFALYPIIAYCSNVHVTRGVMAKQIRELVKGGVKLDYVLWMDDDNAISPAHVERLLVSLDAYPDIDAVTGWCWIQDQVNNRFVTSCGFLNPDTGMCDNIPESEFQSSTGDLLKVDFTGFPLVLMHAHVLEVGQHPFAPILNPNHIWGAMSEDTSFWSRVKSQGLNLFVDRNCYVPHMKTQPLGPQPQFYAPVPAPTPSLPAVETPNPVST